MRLFHELGRALLDAGSMTWQITWSLILGFALSAVIQAVVRREAIARHLAQSQQTLQTQISDCQDKIALPSGCMVPAAAGRSRD